MSSTVHSCADCTDDVKISFTQTPQSSEGCQVHHLLRAPKSGKASERPRKAFFSSVFPSREGDTQLQVRTVLASPLLFSRNILKETQCSHSPG